MPRAGLAVLINCGMERRIVGYRQDDEQHWVAELECGHSQHIRHEPPWQVREWVLTEATRRDHLGTILNCILCDMDGTRTAAYEDARVQGLCHDGAAELVRRPTKGGN